MASKTPNATDESEKTGQTNGTGETDNDDNDNNNNNDNLDENNVDTTIQTSGPNNSTNVKIKIEEDIDDITIAIHKLGLEKDKLDKQLKNEMDSEEKVKIETNINRIEEEIISKRADRNKLYMKLQRLKIISSKKSK